MVALMIYLYNIRLENLLIENLLLNIYIKLKAMYDRE